MDFQEQNSFSQAGYPMPGCNRRQTERGDEEYDQRQGQRASQNQEATPAPPGRDSAKELPCNWERENRCDEKQKGSMIVQYDRRS
jgi:hypothetical protein